MGRPKTCCQQGERLPVTRPAGYNGATHDPAFLPRGRAAAGDGDARLLSYQPRGSTGQVTLSPETLADLDGIAAAAVEH